MIHVGAHRDLEPANQKAPPAGIRREPQQGAISPAPRQQTLSSRGCPVDRLVEPLCDAIGVSQDQSRGEPDARADMDPPRGHICCVDTHRDPKVTPVRKLVKYLGSETSFSNYWLSFHKQNFPTAPESFTNIPCTVDVSHEVLLP